MWYQYFELVPSLNHQPSLIENPVYCNVHYHKIPYPFGCINNLENAMSEYFIVENVKLRTCNNEKVLRCKTQIKLAHILCIAIKYKGVPD